MERPKDLPDFNKPPVVEVVFMVAFEPLKGFHLGHLGLFWNLIKADFPETTERNRIEPVTELFGTRNPAKSELVLRLADASEVPRTWFQNPDRTKLIQIQSNMFCFNWRQESEELYPRYEAVKDSFAKYFSTFCNFVTELLNETVNVSQCELTYVNHIPLKEESGAGEAPKMFKFIGSASMPFEQDFLSLGAKYILRDEEKYPWGRLHLKLDYSYHAKKKCPHFEFTLTTRGLPRTGEFMSFFDDSRRVIVNSFAEMTTESAHVLWERIL